jgi:hypothetical protein
MPTISRHPLIGAVQRDSRFTTAPYPILLGPKAVISYPQQER